MGAQESHSQPSSGRNSTPPQTSRPPSDARPRYAHQSQSPAQGSLWKQWGSDSWGLPFGHFLAGPSGQPISTSTPGLYTNYIIYLSPQFLERSNIILNLPTRKLSPKVSKLYPGSHKLGSNTKVWPLVCHQSLPLNWCSRTRWSHIYGAAPDAQRHRPYSPGAYEQLGSLQRNIWPPQEASPL